MGLVVGGVGCGVGGAVGVSIQPQILGILNRGNTGQYIGLTNPASAPLCITSQVNGGYPGNKMVAL